VPPVYPGPLPGKPMANVPRPTPAARTIPVVEPADVEEAIPVLPPAKAIPVVPVVPTIEPTVSSRPILEVGGDQGQELAFTVYRPRQVASERWHPLLVFAHRADEDTARAVKEQARRCLGLLTTIYQPRTEDAAQPVPWGGQLTLVPDVPGLEFNPPQRSFLLREDIHREEFRFRATAGMEGRTVRGRLGVFSARSCWPR